MSHLCASDPQVFLGEKKKKVFGKGKCEKKNSPKAGSTLTPMLCKL